MKTARKQFTRVNEKEFKSIKMLKAAGLNPNQASVASKRTYKVVKSIYEAENMQEYHVILAAYNKASKPEPKQQSLPVLNENQVLDDIMRTLAQVKESVDALVEAKNKPRKFLR